MNKLTTLFENTKNKLNSKSLTKSIVSYIATTLGSTLALISTIFVLINVTSCSDEKPITPTHEVITSNTTIIEKETTTSDATTSSEEIITSNTTIVKEETVTSNTTISPEEIITSDTTIEETTVDKTDTQISTNITKGIDVSKWQSVDKKPIDWEKVKNSGMSFVIIRAGYRSTSSNELCEDPFFKEHIEGAIVAGLQVGVYFHSQAVTEAEALEEVDYLISLIKGYDIKYPVCCDYEPTLNARDEVTKLNKTEATNIIKTFLRTVKEHGYDAMLYSDHSDINDYLYIDQLSDYKIWIGCYDKKYENTGIQYKTGDPLPFETYTYHMWQYSCTGNVPGIQGNVDLNVAFFQPN